MKNHELYTPPLKPQEAQENSVKIWERFQVAFKTQREPYKFQRQAFFAYPLKLIWWVSVKFYYVVCFEADSDHGFRRRFCKRICQDKSYLISMRADRALEVVEVFWWDRIFWNFGNFGATCQVRKKNSALWRQEDVMQSVMPPFWSKKYTLPKFNIAPEKLPSQ